MRSRFGVCVLLPNGAMSAYPMSSQKMMTTFGGRSAARLIGARNMRMNISAWRQCLIVCIFSFPRGLSCCRIHFRDRSVASPRIPDDRLFSLQISRQELILGFHAIELLLFAN